MDSAGSKPTTFMPMASAMSATIRADRAQSHDAQRLALDLAAGKARLSFSSRADISAASVMPASDCVGEARQDAARGQQHAGHHELFHGVGVGPAC